MNHPRPGHTWISRLALALLALFNLQAAENPLVDRARLGEEGTSATQPTLGEKPPLSGVQDILDWVATHHTAQPTAANRRQGAAAKLGVTQEQMRGIGLIEGNKGVATGFAAKMHDILFVVTNLHVLGDNEKLKITTLDGKPLAVSGIVGAVGADIALLRITDPDTAPPVLTITADMMKVAQINDQVVVVGNRLGGGVATQTMGKLIGLGPDRVELDAQFQPGNSGSPVIHLHSGEVVGVASYQETLTTQDVTGKDAQVQTQKRWFAYRLDAIAKWETIDWNRWQAQMKTVATFRENSIALLNFLRGDFNRASQNLEIRKIIQNFNAAAQALNPDKVKTASSKQELLADPIHNMIRYVLAYADEGTKDFSENNYYDFFRSETYWDTNVPAQTEFRGMIIKALKEINDNMRDFQTRIVK